MCGNGETAGQLADGRVRMALKALKTSQGEVEFVRLEGESGGRPGKATKRPWAAGSTSKRACGTDLSPTRSL
jgi:hypothetical protein